MTRQFYLPFQNSKLTNFPSPPTQSHNYNIKISLSLFLSQKILDKTKSSQLKQRYLVPSRSRNSYSPSLQHISKKEKTLDRIFRLTSILRHGITEYIYTVNAYLGNESLERSIRERRVCGRDDVVAEWNIKATPGCWPRQSLKVWVKLFSSRTFPGPIHRSVDRSIFVCEFLSANGANGVDA